MELEKENENSEKRYLPLPLEKLNALKSPKDSNDHKPHRHRSKTEIITLPNEVLKNYSPQSQL